MADTTGLVVIVYGYHLIMPIPSPLSRKKAYEREAILEIISFAITFVGLGTQIVLSYVQDSKPNIAQQLASALYGPDRETKLEMLASKPLTNLDMPIVSTWLVTFLGIVLLFWFKYKRAKQKDLLDSQMKSPEGLRGSVFVMYELVKKHMNVEVDDGSIRVTIYRVTEPKPGEIPELEQAIDYVGSKKSKLLRKYPVSVGIIGLAARTGEPQVGQRFATDDDEYRRELVKEWGFTKEMAANITIDRRSFIAIPIMEEADEVIGVVYADSSIDKAFDPFIEDLIAATYGVAAYIKERY